MFAQIIVVSGFLERFKLINVFTRYCLGVRGTPFLRDFCGSFHDACPTMSPPSSSRSTAKSADTESSTE